MPQDRGRKCSHLPGRLILDKLLEDPVCLGGQLGFRPGLFEVLARQPEVKVLLAELRLQEGVEGCHPTWGGERRTVNGAEGGEEEDHCQTQCCRVSIALGAQTMTYADFLSLQANSTL